MFQELQYPELRKDGVFEVKLINELHFFNLFSVVHAGDDYDDDVDDDDYGDDDDDDDKR